MKHETKEHAGAIVRKKPATKKRAANTRKPKKYTALTFEDVGEIMAEATGAAVRDCALSADIVDHFEVEEYEEARGTFFVQYYARTWRDAVAFSAAVIGQAFALGYFAEPSATWRDELQADDGKRRLVSVFVTAADFMGDDGHPVI